MSATVAELVPKKPVPGRDRVDLRAEPEWIARVQAQADRLGMALSAYIRMATTKEVERDEKQQRELEADS
jgi:hypothetical protein